MVREFPSLRKMKSKIKRIIICCIPVTLLILVYCLGAMFYNDVFLPNTFLNNTNVGGMKVLEVENKAQAATNDLSMVITRSDDSTEEIKLSDIDYTAKYETDIQKIKDEQNPFKWLFAFFKEEHYEVKLVTSYDETMLNNEIEAMKCISNEAIQDPINAHIEKTDAGFIVVDAIDGNRLDEAKVKNVIKSALDKGNLEVNLSEENCYLTASIRADSPEITNIMNKIDKFNNLVIKIDMTDAEETIDFTVLKDWITDENGDINLNEAGEVVINEELVKDYVNKLSVQYNTYGSKRKFKATDIGEIIVGGTKYDSYGFQLKLDKTRAVIMDAINKGESTTVKPVWNIPAACRGENDIGNTYLEVDLTRQHMWFYVDGKLYSDTDIVSGSPRPETETPTGMFRIWHKERNTYLDGPGYHTKVSYWMPFSWTGCGIHDAKWRNSFGGDIYKHGGSHGCLNTPYDEVQKIFEKIKYDTPVVVYKS